LEGAVDLGVLREALVAGPAAVVIPPAPPLDAPVRI
jgi:hypothetical protein